MRRTMTMICALALTAGSLFAQEPVTQKNTRPLECIEAGSVLRAGDRVWTPLATTKYTATDIKANKYDFDAILKSGKKILIDFSTVWCPPCWQLHGSGKLDALLAKFGPSGTNELVVLWVDCEGSSIEAIEGKGKSPGGRASMGDWTKGGKWPVPIVSDAKMNKTIGVPVTGVPTLVLLSPAGDFTDVAQEVRAGTEDDFAAVLKSCQTDKSKPEISKVIFPEAGALAGVPVSFSAMVRSVAAITGYKWTFEGATPATSTDKTPSVTWAKVGTYKVTLTVTNANGDSEPVTKEIKIVEKQDVNKFPYAESFENNLNPNWTLIDADGDGYNWVTVKDLFVPFNVQPENLSAFAHTGDNAVSSWSFRPTGPVGPGGWPGESLTTDNYLVTPVVELPGDAMKPEIGFWICSFAPDYKDSYKVMVSTTGAAKADFTDELKALAVAPVTVAENGSRTWNQVVLSLEKYKGKKIYIAFVHQSEDKFGLLLDDVAIALDGTLSNERVARAEAGLQIAVNAVNESIDVAGEGLRAVRVFDVTGRAIAAAKAVGGSIVLNTSGYGQGVYILRADTAAGEVVRKVIVR